MFGQFEVNLKANDVHESDFMERLPDKQQEHIVTIMCSDWVLPWSCSFCSWSLELGSYC